MKILVLSVPDCPNLAALDHHLAEVTAGRAEITVDHRVINDEMQARQWGMRGSPTVLINGVDPFAVAGTGTSMGCRVFRDASGAPRPCPDVAQLREAVARYGDQAAPVAGCCEDPGSPETMVAALRGGRARRSAPGAGGLRAVQLAVLRSFAATGAPPGSDELQRVASLAGTTATEALSALHEQDYVRLDEHGAIRGAYPFSAVPTRHRVTVDGGVEVFAMCAIDALGIPAMLGTDAVVTATTPTTPTTEEGIEVRFLDGKAQWSPETAVVFVGMDSAADGPAAEVCCGHVNFFATFDSARRWAGEHGSVDGTILGRDEAEALGRNIFGDLLIEPPPHRG